MQKLNSINAHRNIFLKTLHDGRWGVLLVGSGLFVIGLCFSLVYPSIADTYVRMIEVLPQFLQSFLDSFSLPDTVEGFLTIELFGFLAPVIMMGFAIRRGVLAIAGEEERGTLDQLMSNPVSRFDVLWQKFLAMVASCAAPVVLLGLSLQLGATVMGYSIALDGMLYMLVGLLLLSWATGSIALSVGAVTGKNSTSVAVPCTVAGIGYLINFMESLTSVLSFSKYISIVDYYIGNDPFVNGLNYWHVAVLAGISLTSFFIAVHGFNTRDLN